MINLKGLFFKEVSSKLIAEASICQLEIKISINPRKEFYRKAFHHFRINL